MARLHQVQIKANENKLKSDNVVQRDIQASEKHSFEKALKLAKAQSLQNDHQTTDAYSALNQLLASDEQDDWLGYTSHTAITVGAFQPGQLDSVANSSTEHNNAAQHLSTGKRELNADAASRVKQLEELDDWLAETLDQDQGRAGGWLFEFENTGAQLVRLQVYLEEDGQWSAFVDMDTSADDRQQLESALNKQGVELSRTAIR